MSLKDWNVVVSELGKADSQGSATVSATTWLAALQAGREELGVSSALPPGASCSVSEEGVVTFHDIIGRQTYRLYPQNQAATDEEGAPSEPPDTVANTWASRSTPPPPPPEALQQSLSKLNGTKDPPRKELVPAKTVHALRLVSRRDEDPSGDSPLCYRERNYAASEEISAGIAETLALRVLAQLREELADNNAQCFFHIAIFDHLWDEDPLRQPLVRVQWKDWHRSIEIDFPLEEAERLSERPPASSVPPPAADDRLIAAFKACSDLMFLTNRAEAVVFAVRLLDELIGCDAITGCLYDIDEDAFRIVSAVGIGAEGREGAARPADRGILQTVSELSVDSTLDIPDVSKNKLFDAEVDSIKGLKIGSAIYQPLAQGERILGFLELLKHKKRGFSPIDIEITHYVGEQLSLFISRVHSIRIQAVDGVPG